jgi:superfamily II DNA or RNA helicase
VGHKEIDKLIEEAQLELQELESKQREVLERIRQLRVQKSTIAENTEDNKSVATKSFEIIENKRKVSTNPREPTVINSSPQIEKISLFRSLFKGREDVFPKRYENTKTGKSGYQPSCSNEWVKGICEKPRINCADCDSRSFIPVSDAVIESHLKGFDKNHYSNRDYTIGVYPLLLDETCWLLAVDFDKTTWTTDSLAFQDTCDFYNIPSAFERSRSGNGAHVWIFFNEAIPAAMARKLGTFLLTETMEKRPEIGLDSYDRFFPSQNNIPKGGFGNLIALPLQKKPRDDGNSVFIEKNLVPFVDQWAFLSLIGRISRFDVENILNQATNRGGLLGVKTVTTDEDQIDPWIEPPSRRKQEPKILGPLPKQIEIVVGNQIYIEKNILPPSLLNRIIRIAAFQNPEFYKAQAMRLSTYNKPRIISCCEDFPKHIGLPRGCIDELISLLSSLEIKTDFKDERFAGSPIDVNFFGTLNTDQEKAVTAISCHDTGVLAASTAFGKTVVATYLIALRKANTLILVHRKQLLDQWVDSLSFFLNIDPKEIGQISGDKRKTTGSIDVALIQSLNKKSVVDDIVGEYGHLIVDECHHISARSFEIVARQCKAKFVTGLSATVVRKDGHHPIIFMNCGPVRYRVSDRQQAEKRPFNHKVIVRPTEISISSNSVEKDSLAIHKIYSTLVSDNSRNDLIVNDVIKAVDSGRSPLILTERREHLELLNAILSDKVEHVFAFKGGMGKKQRKALLEKMNEVKSDEERILIATGKYLGEGFDDARLDTLFLTLPISWKGTLAQYAGRLHRLYDGKSEVIIYDYADLNIPMLSRMHQRRLSGYKAIGYEVKHG